MMGKFFLPQPWGSFNDKRDPHKVLKVLLKKLVPTENIDDYNSGIKATK